MQEQQGPPNETPGKEPAESTRKVTWPKRGVAPALRSATFPRTRVPATSGLSSRDLRLLCWMGEQYGARLDHLQALTGSGMTMVRRIVRGLRAAGLVRTERIVMREPTWAIPTAKGLAACDLPFEVWTPALGQLPHVGAVNDARIHVQTRTPRADWICERRINTESRSVGVGLRRKHMPDGVAVLDGREMAIEVELARKSTPRVQAILDELTSRYDAVLYFCAPLPYAQLTRLAQSGRWRALGVRELPGPPSPNSER
jgi:hypothetical protein